MLAGVAVVVTSLFISALAAATVDTVYQALAARRWPADLPAAAAAVVVSIAAVVVGAYVGSVLA